jgi:hypothetical protein
LCPRSTNALRKTAIKKGIAPTKRKIEEGISRSLIVMSGVSLTFGNLNTNFLFGVLDTNAVGRVFVDLLDHL